MDIAVVKPGQRAQGTITVPGDKSISHRVAMMAALASGTSLISGFLHAEDCLNTLKALGALGATIEFPGDTHRITGGKWHVRKNPLVMGNSGTGLRLMAGLLAGRPWTSELTGDESLRSRPMERIKEPLEKMGARLELTGNKGCAPIRITGGKLRAIDYEMPVASAQVKSCVLLAALFADGVTNVIEKKPTRDHTEQIFRRMGIPLIIEGDRISVRGFGASGPALEPIVCEIPGDFSSAAFWLAAACAKPGSRIIVRQVGLNPRRTGLLDVLRRMGAQISVVADENAKLLEPCGTVSAEGGRLQATTVGGAEIPNIIDELPLVAVLGALAQGITVISGARELRVKESDRIAVMAANLRLLGVELEEKEDGLIINGGGRLRGEVTVDSFGDHRVAMAMAIMALYAESPVTIRNIACVATSYPEFWNNLRRIGADVGISYCD
ncbi:MAG: 3-phosphoshikimate 1-carboxyvinyltransferase [Kiritimatiellia bacterium]|nr:3-phosphoshikimate 1-carboxyvinyltransferase [Kiritimatiellia bacterium]